MSPERPRFVLHEHQVPRHHFDLRLEEDGVLRSWALPRGLPQDPAHNRLAVAVADHDLDHVTYQDETKSIADEGTWEAQDRTERRFLFVLHGRHGSARYALIRTGQGWLLHLTKEQPMAARVADSREGVSLTNLDQPLFDGSGATKRDLVDYLDAVSARLVPVLEHRPLSVMRVLRGQAPFMQKNVSKYAPDWLPTVTVATQSRGQVHYPLCNDRRALLWFANQRAVEFHPTLFRYPGAVDGSAEDESELGPVPTHLVLDLDPPEGSDAFEAAVQAALLVREALSQAGLAGVAKTSGAKGVHVYVPVVEQTSFEDLAAATRAIAARAERLDPALATTAFIRENRDGKVFVDSTRSGGTSVIAAYSPRLRPGVPVSFPVPWSDLEQVAPADFTVHTAIGLLGDSDPWAELMPAPQTLPADLVQEGHTIPVARVQAMHEGKRRARARRADTSLG